MNRPHRTPVVNVGIISLMTLFTILLLTAFSVLSLVSAKSDLRLNQVAAESVQAYYASDSQAETWWMELCQLAQHTPQTGLPQALSASGYTFEEEDGALLVHTQVPMGDTKELAVTARIQWVDGAAQVSRVQWQTRVLDSTTKG